MKITVSRMSPIPDLKWIVQMANTVRLTACLMTEITSKAIYFKKGKKLRKFDTKELIKEGIQITKPKVHFNFEDNHDKNSGLPKRIGNSKPKLGENKFLKLHRLKNPVHEHDRENARSLCKNMALEESKKLKDVKMKLTCRTHTSAGM
jgi:hypothetical protein